MSDPVHSVPALAIFGRDRIHDGKSVIVCRMPAIEFIDNEARIATTKSIHYRALWQHDKSVRIAPCNLTLQSVFTSSIQDVFILKPADHI
jgi:hypothetical protein